MKIFGACFLSVAITVALMLWFLPGQGERCETIQIAYEKTIELQDQMIQQKHDTADFLLARIAINQQRLDKLHDALGKAVTEKDFLMHEVQSKKFELAEIQALAARLTPVEAAAKEDAKQRGGWVVPWLKEQIWRGAAAYGMRGK